VSDLRACLRAIHAMRFLTLEQLVAQSYIATAIEDPEDRRRRIERILDKAKKDGLVMWIEALGYWLTGKGVEAATGQFTVEAVRAGR